jgi:hypothetical protein
MGKIREMEKLAKSPGVKMAVVQVKYGESLKKAWNRHLTENPGDASVMIKIFNKPVLLQRKFQLKKDINDGYLIDNKSQLDLAVNLLTGYTYRFGDLD